MRLERGAAREREVRRAVVDEQCRGLYQVRRGARHLDTQLLLSHALARVPAAPPKDDDLVAARERGDALADLAHLACRLVARYEGWIRLDLVLPARLRQGRAASVETGQSGTVPSAPPQPAHTLRSLC